MGKLFFYGAGAIGDARYELFKQLDHCDDIVAYVDKNWKMLKSKNGIPVISYEDAKHRGIPFLITVSSKYNGYAEVEKMLINDKMDYYKSADDYFFLEYGMEKKEINRIMCVLTFQTVYKEYYADAEKYVDKYWKEGSTYATMFKKLDTKNIVELGCGHGRHVDMYYKLTEKVTLVEYSEECVEYCKKRFEGRDNVQFIHNNGIDLRQLKDGEYSALFTYDTFIQLEMFDIFSYLNETYRVLQKGGRALFHHSNYHDDYKSRYTLPGKGNMRSWAFMSADLFAYLSSKAGFEILDQKLLDWGDISNVECLTLVEKR